MAKAVTLNDGATLIFDDLSSTKKLTLGSTLAFASGTVNLAFSADSDKRAFEDDKVIIDWTTYNAIPDGNFAFSNASLANDWVLLKTATGLKVYGKSIIDEEDGDAGEISAEDDGSLKATVEPTGKAVTVPTYVTKLELSVSDKAIGTLTAAGVDAADVVVKYGETVTTGAYSITKEGNVISFDINEDADAAVGGNKVKPEVATTSPMTYTGSAPTFSIKAIPGLWYAVKAYSSPACDDVTPGTGTAVQATTSSVSPTAPALGVGDVVKYYKVIVGASEDAVE